MKLIDKDAVMAEIERKCNNEVQWMQRQGYTDYNMGLRDAYVDILSYIESLEVKEVDLDNEKDAYICNHFSEGSDGGMISDAYREIGGVTYFDLSNIAEYFFELGLKKAQKGG